MELDQNQFCCSVCLDLLNEPITIPCGHSYCKSCIEGCWDEEGETEEYSCPQCRETFNPRPVLRRNSVLAQVVEKLKKTSTQQASPSACAGPADVACDFCCGTEQNKATMSCLTCLASYCPAHLEPHYTVPVLKKHHLVSATIPLQDRMCTKHNKLMEIYCQTDERCICYLCVIDEHKHHDTLSAAAEKAKEQKQLFVSQKKAQERFQEREKELNELVQAMKDFKLIKAREKTAVAQAEELQLQLEKEIAKLRRRDAELEQLSHVDDPIHFIQTFESLSTPCESPDLPLGAVVCSQRMFTTVADIVSELRDDIEGLLEDTWTTISATDCCPLTLDGNSAHKYLSLSQGNWRVTALDYKICYSAHSDRFMNIKQVLCKEGLSERRYWEVSRSGRDLSVAVSYKDISRLLLNSQFGNNNKSWSLECSSKGYSFRHNKRSIPVSGPQSSRIGVFLDYRAGTLSFYSISDTMTLLHKEQTMFTQPLYPGLGLHDTGSWAELKLGQ